MKKAYSIPTVEFVNVVTAAIILNASVEFGGGSNKPAASESRGEWGNVW